MSSKTKKVSASVGKGRKRNTKDDKKSMEDSHSKVLRDRRGSTNTSSTSLFNFNFTRKRSSTSQNNAKVLKGRRSSKIPITSSKSSIRSTSKATKSQGKQRTKKLVANVKKPASKQPSSELEDDQGSGIMISKKKSSSPLKETPPVFSSSESEDGTDDISTSAKKKSSAPQKSLPHGEQKTKKLVANVKKTASKRSSSELENDHGSEIVPLKKKSLSLRVSTQGNNNVREAEKTINTSKSQPSMPSGTNNAEENVVLSVLVSGNYNEYSCLQNAHPHQYIKVPLSSPCLNYAYPTDYKWVTVNPGVAMSVIFNIGTVKTGYIRIAERTVKPFERTTTGQVLVAVVEGEITVKSTSFDFNTRGEPVLQSVSLPIGSYISIPNNSMYTLENRTDEECCIHYCHVRT